MKIVIAGATGFLGRPLVAALLADGHAVVVLSRSDRATIPGARIVAWDPQRVLSPWAIELDGADAVINLPASRLPTIGGRRLENTRSKTAA
jgi:nucleoside-diphosphate-sugar epimerase